MEIVTRMAGRDGSNVLASAGAGDESAFRRIIVEYHDDMRRVCLAICGDPTIAEDATQAAWIIAWRKIGDVYGPAHLRPWLVSIAVNEARKLMRSRRRRTDVEETRDTTDRAGGIDPATGVDALDLRAALARLDPEDSALLAMRYVAGFDSNELSLATGISPSGTRSRLERLLKRLREDLSDG